MTDGTALLAAIIEHPDDDDPRLRYADWLQEQGQEARAEFIRLQIADPAPPGTPPEGYPLRQRQLWAGHVRSWVGLPTDWTYHPMEFLASGVDQWRRGFLQEATCAAADWLAHGDAIAWHPEHRFRRPCPPTAHPVRRVALTTRPEFPCRDVGMKHTESLVAGEWVLLNDEPDPVADALRRRWPGVEFTVPTPPGRWVEATHRPGGNTGAASRVVDFDFAASLKKGETVALARVWTPPGVRACLVEPRGTRVRVGLAGPPGTYDVTAEVTATAPVLVVHSRSARVTLP